MTPQLKLGPLLRYVSETEATVWVETDQACEVEVLGHRAETFCVEAHHYALVVITGLEPAGSHEYEVALDGATCWPAADSDLPPSVIRTLGGDDPLDICFGSCRVALPHEGPYIEPKDEGDEGFEFDALRVLANQMVHSDRHKWPELLFLLGDQVYVDEGSPETREKIRERRGTDEPPGDEVTDFEEYTWLYQESWSDPLIRWLFSTVSTSMVWDDHDMSDDWNISRSWVEEMNQKPWWHHRAVAGIESYWVYQHIGNLSPRELEDSEIYQEVADGGNQSEALRDWAAEIDSTGHGTRWSFCRDIGGVRAIFMDSRAGRVVEHGRRAIMDDNEWEWIVDHATGDFDHLLISTTVPYVLAPSLHHFEAWNERVGAGAWGMGAARLAEKARRAVDFDHWGSFAESFARMRELLVEVGSGERGRAPASIVILSGDVHHAYLAEIGFPRGTGVESHVYQAVCSPYRNPLDERERLVIRTSFNRVLARFMAALARSAGAQEPGIDWRLSEGPYFDNQVATIRLDGRQAIVQLDKTFQGDDGKRRLECVFERRIS